MPNWTKDQKKAIELPVGNILVSASAGSGKTAVLIERVISKVLQDRVDIDKILVVTFTNASAAELKEKLVQAIYLQLEKDSKNIFLKRQLELINQATITTIDAFCLDIVRKNFFELGIDPNFTICDQDTASLLKSKALENVIECTYTKETEEKFGLYQVLHLFSGKEEKMLESMLMLYQYCTSFEYPLAWLKEKIEKYKIENQKIDLYQLEFGKEIYLQIQHRIRSLLGKIAWFDQKLPQTELLSCYHHMFEIDKNSIQNLLLSKPNWDVLTSLLHEISFRNMPSKKEVEEETKKEISTFRKDVIKKEIASFQKMMYASSEKVLDDLNKMYPYLDYIYHFIEDFHQEYASQKEEKGLLDFSDIEHMAMQVLVNRKQEKLIETEYAKRLQEKFYEVYTDEYQDTSYVQEAILNAVSKGNRFMVGDVKQSIYQFRQAVPDIFNAKYAAYTNAEQGTKVILSENFRSRKQVLHSINYLFCQLMSSEVGACEYEKKEVLKVGNKEFPELVSNCYQTEIHLLDLLEKPDEEQETEQTLLDLKKYDIEAKYIAKKIELLMHEFQVYDAKKGKFCPIRYRDIAILIRGDRNKMNILLKELKACHIPAFSDSSENMLDSDEIKLVLSFLKILDNKYQDIEMVSVLYSILGKFTLDEIYHIKKQETGYLYDCLIMARENEKDPILKKKILSFLSLLEKFEHSATIYGVAKLIRMLYEETDLYYQISLLKNATQARMNLNALLSKATSLDSNSSIYSFLLHVENLNKVKSSDSSVPKLIGENEDVVRIMTIHKSKGLEFPVVILSDCSKKYNFKDKQHAILLENSIGIGCNILEEETMVTYPSILKERIKQKLDESTKSEELRLLYVAMTRAKEKLIIFGTIQDYSKKIENLYVSYQENGKIEPSLVRENTSYLDHLLMGIKKYKKFANHSNLFQLSVHPVYQDLSKDVLEQEEETTLSSLEFSNQEKKIIQRKIEALTQDVQFVYPYLLETTLPNKVTVSELKEEKRKEEGIEQEIVLTKPAFLNAHKQEYTRARKGTLVHFILEHLDIAKVDTKQDLYQDIQRLLENHLLSKEDYDQLDIESLSCFIQSDIYHQLKKSKKIEREKEFILKDFEISPSLIQGVIDLYYQNEEGSYTLVDFKTDRFTEDKQAIQRYSVQLNIYKKAIEKLTHIPVTHTYIYSFHLRKEVELG